MAIKQAGSHTGKYDGEKESRNEDSKAVMLTESKESKQEGRHHSRETERYGGKIGRTDDRKVDNYKDREFCRRADKQA